MARRSTRQMNQSNRYVSGNLAYDYDYLERERQRQAERERREFAERRARETAVRREPRRKSAAAPRQRERQHVSPLILLGFAAAAVMLVMILMDYARLTAISNDVVTIQRELTALEEEHVALVSRYERTFDLAAVKEAAEASGMAKPSASQIYYVDLSVPDNVVIYHRESSNVLGRVCASVGQNVISLVEYFK